MIKAKTVILENPYKLVFEGKIIEKKEIKKNQLLCETYYTAISPGTETAAYTGKPPLSSNITYPRLLGYCNVSKILKIGRGVNSFRPGQFILTFSSHCSHSIINEKDVLCILPDGINKKFAACAYLFHLGYNAVISTGICYGAYVTVIGLGFIGLATIKMAINAGAKVFAISDSKVTSDLAINIGAHAVYNRNNYMEIAVEYGERLCDYVITTTNSWDDWRISLKLAGNRSTIGVVGFPGRDKSLPKHNPLDSNFFYQKQLTIKALGLSPEENDSRNFLKFNEKTNLAFIISQMLDDKIDASKFISDVIDPEKIEYAYQSIINRKHSAATYILKWKK